MNRAAPSATYIRELRARVQRALELSASPEGNQFSLGDRPIAIYGAGGMGLKVHRVLAGQGLRPQWFLDRARGGQGEVEGVPILHPTRNALTPAERAGLDVIVAVFNPEADPLEIERSLEEAGYERRVSFRRLHRVLGDALGDQYWLTTPVFYATHAQEILETVDIWGDRQSGELFAALLEWRAGGINQAMPSPTLSDQYFPADLPADPRPLRLVDCGAYLGDTIESARRHVPRIESVCAFEPDPDSFRRLAAWAESQQEALGFELFLWPCGVGDEFRSAPFVGGAGGASRFDSGGTVLTLRVALDDVLPSYRPTLIKMDIEGAEPEALAGSRRLIARALPRLAISAYHRPEHIWSIARLVREIAPAYDLRLRLHRFNGFDLVLYAFPRL